MSSWSKIFIIGGLFFLVIAFSYFFYLLGPAQEEGSARSISIGAGAGVAEIAEILGRENLLRSQAVFKIYSFFSGRAHLLKPGHYLFSANLSAPEIVGRLTQGPPDTEVLITEGESLKDADTKLSSLGLIQPGAFLNFPAAQLKTAYPFLGSAKTLEGFLFPDTYRLAPDSSVEAIAKKFLDNFDNKVLEFKGLSANQIGKSFYERLILASLLEKEVPFSEDRRLVAGILEKRLKIGMPLQVDATVVYVSCGGRFSDCPALTKNDYGIKSSYNTYYARGLPPGPIANPGLDAILAALNPQSSPFLYYLSDPKTQKTVFAKTLEEHNINRARYLPRYKP